ncbi:MAG: methyltransferase domain-containing protein [Polyangiaceae bacterium]
MTETWWQLLYDDVLADVLLERSAEETRQTVNFLLRALELRPGQSVFDQCAGIGSLSRPLAQAGLSVVSVEQAANYVERARSAASSEGIELQAHVGDAFEFVAPQKCDGAFNWWTGFGYAESDAANGRMLSRAFESLAPGACYLLDWLNLSGVLRRFAPEVVVERETPAGPVRLVRRSRIDLGAGSMIKQWIFERADGTRVERESRVRLYLPHQLADLMRAAGFVDLQLWGDEQFGELKLDSPRTILRGRRP